MDVDTVGVVGRADWSDGCQGCGCLPPGTTGHGAGVVDQEDGIESGEERVGIIGCGADGRRVGGWCIGVAWCWTAGGCCGERIASW